MALFKETLSLHIKRITRKKNHHFIYVLHNILCFHLNYKKKEITIEPIKVEPNAVGSADTWGITVLLLPELLTKQLCSFNFKIFYA